MSQKQREKDQRRKARKARKASSKGGSVPSTDGEEVFKTVKLGPRVAEGLKMLQGGLAVPLWRVTHRGRSICAIVHADQREMAWEEAEATLGKQIGPIEGWVCLPLGVAQALPTGWLWAAHPFSTPGYVPFAFRVQDPKQVNESMLWADAAGKWGRGHGPDGFVAEGSVMVDGNDPSVTVLRGVVAVEAVVAGELLERRVAEAETGDEDAD